MERSEIYKEYYRLLKQFELIGQYRLAELLKIEIKKLIVSKGNVIKFPNSYTEREANLLCFRSCNNVISDCNNPRLFWELTGYHIGEIRNTQQLWSDKLRREIMCQKCRRDGYAKSIEDMMHKDGSKIKLEIKAQKDRFSNSFFVTIDTHDVKPQIPFKRILIS